MTAEIGVLNKTAVALAADSAATISMGNGCKINDTANKLFALSKYEPIGIMIYGNAEFMGVPWETLIKLYRKKLGNRVYDYTKNYFIDFISFLETQNGLFPEPNQRDYVIYTIYGNFRAINEDVYETINLKYEETCKITENEIKKVISQVIDSHYEKWNNANLLDNFSNDFYDQFYNKYKDIIAKAIEEVFKFPLSKTQKEKLSFFTCSLFCKNRFKKQLSGIVIAGFGEKEIYPSLCAFEVESIIDNKLKYKINVEHTISERIPAYIGAFAQQEIVQSFINGIDPNLEQFTLEHIRQVFLEFPKIIIEEFNKGKIRYSSKLKHQLQEIGKELFNSFVEDLDSYKEKRHIEPILNMIEFLQKDELATVAETLVNMTSFKRKFSTDMETVGGPIDVAVISKGDGFIWIKRKHYFKADLNKIFIENYFRS